MMTVQDKLRELREKKGLSQEELAAELGVSRQTIGKWENGRAVPRGDNLDRLSRYYGVTIDTLMNGGPPETAAPEPEKAPQPPARKKRPWLIVAAVVLLAMLIAAGGMVWWSTADRSVPMEPDVIKEVTEPLPPALPLLPLDEGTPEGGE